MNKRILIVTNRADIHADLVIDRILAGGGSPFRLNLDEFPANFTVDLELASGEWSGILTHLPSREVLSVRDIGAVWARKSADFVFESQDLTSQEKAYASGEMEHILFSLLYALDCYWMSHPLAVRGAMWKGEQLLRAAKFGFHIPASMISNQADSVLQFRTAVGGDIVFKALSSPFLAADKVDADDRIASGLATTRIVGEHDEILESVRELPCFFQQHIPKQYELRVTIVDDLVFAAKIHSQDDDRTKTDYRDFSAEIRYEAAKLPAEIEDRCRAYVQSYGLTFGAIDLIVTPDGEYVFLENNPAGQFLFVEQLVPELKMIDAVAERLIEGARHGKVTL